MIHNTRIAPSPSGNMHLGTARTAYFNYLAARASGGQFHIRIDDTDRSRSAQKYTDNILECMDWLGLDYDYISFQSNNFDLYRETAEELTPDFTEYVDGGAIALSGKGNWFIPTKWTDEIAGEILVSDQETKNIQDTILIKSDGSPSYHFASVMDDKELGVNHIIRGVDHISNTAKQLTLWEVSQLRTSCKVPFPKFSHVGLITQNKKVLSKRDDAMSLLSYKEQGIHPEAMLNFLLRLGWAETDGKTIKKIPKDLAIDIFLKKGKMRNAPSNLDLDLLKAINRKYK